MVDLKKIIAGLRGSTSTAAHIRDALSKIDTDALEAAAEKLEGDRRRVLLDGTDRELEAIEAKITAANRDVERAYAAKAELERRLEEVAAAEVEGERLARYTDAKAKADAAARVLRKEYPEIGKRFVALLRTLAEATIAVNEANEHLPAGAERLNTPEMIVRTRLPEPEQIIEEREIELWCHANGNGIMPEEAQKRLNAEDNGSGRSRPFQGWNAEKRRFTRRTYLPSIPVQRPSPLSDINLPGLTAGDPPFWRATDGSQATGRTVLARLAELADMKPSNPAQREQRVDFIPINDVALVPSED